MGELNLEGFVARGWHGINFVTDRDPNFYAVRFPNSQPEYNMTNLFGVNIKAKIPVDPAQVSGGYAYVMLPGDWTQHDAIVSEQVIGFPGFGLIRPFEVFQETKTQGIERVSVPRRIFGVTLGERIEERQQEILSYIPVYLNMQGNLTTKKSDNERLLGVNLEFNDPRAIRGYTSAQYTALFRESDYKALLEEVERDPSVLFRMCNVAFPEYLKFQKDITQFQGPKKFVIANSPEQMRAIAKSLSTE